MRREPPCRARRPGSRDGAEWEALWAAQPEAEVKEGRAGAGEWLELQGLLPGAGSGLRIAGQA